jgi:DNA-binding NarL/FixJ family response regulator
MNVLIAEDHPMFRDGLRALLADRAGVTSVRTTATGQDALTAAEEQCPDVAVVDLRMPSGDGVWLTRQLRARFPSVRVLVLTSSADDVAVHDALAAGANGYLLKTADPEEIAEAVTAVAAGASVLSDEVLAMVAAPRRRRAFPQLTDREFAVLEHLAGGDGTDAIAQLLRMSTKTVRNHVSNILVKLGVQDRTAAVVLAHEHGVGFGSTADRQS